jgi:hypothetical protein
LIGDYAEDPDECPVTTTCPVVCVASVAECPPSCNNGETLCAETGQCGWNCGNSSTLSWNESSALCACTTRPVACPRVVDLYPSCLERFQSHYDANQECIDAETTIPEKLSFAGPWFVACYAYYGGLAVAVVVWCWYNQVLVPVSGSTVPLVAAQQASTTNTAGVWTQTGYKIELLGSILETLVQLSFALIQFLLLLTTLFYYMQQEAITRWKPVFKDDVQALSAFIIVWMVGIVWCFAFRYPSTGVQSLFFRRCKLSEAAIVAVVAPIQTIGGTSRSTDSQQSTFLSQVATSVWTPLDSIMRTVFSYPYDQPGLETVFCPVRLEPETGTRSFLHRMRRYVYDEATNCFIPCVMTVGSTFGDFVKQKGGLTREEASQRLGRQGPNMIPLPEPSVFGSLEKEFRKSFYIYQNFVLWAYANFWFYFMAIVYTVFRFAGAFVVVYFQHKSDSLLYNLSRVEGLIEYVRHRLWVPRR